MCNYVAYATQTTQLAQTWYINASLEELCSRISRCANLAKGFFFFFHVLLFFSFWSLAVYTNTSSNQQQEDCGRPGNIHVFN